jgi:actin-like ATPase involved in cell morphogenesis
MAYVVGIDLGTTFTAAAVCRDGERPETVQLGNRGASTPSTLFLRDDDEVLTGHAALRRGLSDPGRLAREFKRRFGDPAPILLGGVPISADALTARLLRATLDGVAEREGAPPAAVAVCHPANWGPYKLDLLDQVCRHAGIAGTVFVSEPEAAAVQYAAQERLDPDALVAVYDLGGGTFDAAVLRRTGDAFEIVGAPDGIERLGGIDFDEAVFAHVRNAVRDEIERLDENDPATLAALARMREECTEAKEALSWDTEASVPVALPGLSTEVLITRVEFEAMIRVPLSETIDALRRALRTANIDAGDLAAVLLVGGSSRIPMVAEMVGAELGRPVAVDADPKHVVALGAARVAARERVAVGAVASAAGRTVAPAVTRAAPVAPAAAAAAPGAPTAPPPPSGPPSDAPRAPRPERQPAARPAREAPDARRSRRRVVPIAIAAAVVVALGAVGAVVALGSGGGGGGGGGFVSACPPAGDPATCISDVSFDGDQLSVAFDAHDVDLGAEAVPIFFLTAVNEQEAASVGNRTSDWRAWGPNSPFQGTNPAGQQGFTAADIDQSQTAVCVLLGDTAGNVAQGTGNCAALPEAE